jgi:tetratricopeptide (TPR) repeat protein
MTDASSVICASSSRRGSRPGAAAARARAICFARRASAFAALVILAAGLSGCNKLKARDLLNKGVAAYKNAQYDAATEDFKKAKALDPGLMNARL